MEFGQSKIDLFDFTSFFALDFFNFLAHCDLWEEDKQTKKDLWMEKTFPVINDGKIQLSFLLAGF